MESRIGNFKFWYYNQWTKLKLKLKLTSQRWGQYEWLCLSGVRYEWMGDIHVIYILIKSIKITKYKKQKNNKT